MYIVVLILSTIIGYPGQVEFEDTYHQYVSLEECELDGEKDHGYDADWLKQEYMTVKMVCERVQLSGEGLLTSHYYNEIRGTSAEKHS